MVEEIQIEILKENDYDEYRKFVNCAPDALYGHSLEVKDLVEQYFKFKPYYLVAKVNGKIVGCLPLFEANSLIEGRRFVSIPFFPFGGVVGDGKALLLKKAKELSKDSKFLEIRQRDECMEFEEEGFVVQKPITDFMMSLLSSEEETMNSFNKKVRYDIRKAEKNNIVVKLGKLELLEDFYLVYLNTRKRRGVPAWPYGLFKDALDKCESMIGVAYLEGKPVAGGFFFFHRDEVEYGFGGADYKYTHLSPYYLLLWEMMKYGVKHKYRVFDFGGSTKEQNDGNMYRFKNNWCDEKKDIPYYFYAKNVENIPTLKKSFGIYKLYGILWRRLPKWFINKISPYVMRQFI